MHDLLIKGATVLDGTGEAAYTADVGVKDGLIADIDRSGRSTSMTQQVVQADGAWLTPGFVDIHTHYDGQATWDDAFTPSIWHGTTTLVMGNCGVGFAPVRKGQENQLIKLMQGVEDIPGSALSEGMRWGWESFEQYMDALAATPKSLDYLVQVPHDPLRMYVMQERALAGESASADDVAQMRSLLRRALQAGAAGFSTGRSDNHRTADGLDTPASRASRQELMGLGQAFEGLKHGVVQMVSDFDLFQAQLGDARFDAEFDLVEDLCRASGRPMSITWLQRDPGGEQYLAVQARAEQAWAKGLKLHLQTATRGIGVMIGLDASFQPFMGHPSYQAIAHLPLAERAALMRQAEWRQRILSEKSGRLAGDGTPVPPLVDMLRANIERISARMFPLHTPGEAEPNYAQDVSKSFYVRAQQRACSVLEAIYDYLCEANGDQVIYFPIFNYNEGNLDVVGNMLQHPQGLLGLSDAGAHVGTVCDVSFASHLLKHWVQDRKQLPLEKAVNWLSLRNAQYLGLKDRGQIALGQRADLNLIDPHALGVGTPQLLRDLPAGGKRFMQKAKGYLGTWVAGQCVRAGDDIMPVKPGRLVRLNAV
jgi:N-acyl-D-aspartate/D-glutamate deacylase